MQLSNEPAETLAKRLVDSSNGAFKMVGYASGGKCSLSVAVYILTLVRSAACRHGSNGRRCQACTTGA